MISVGLDLSLTGTGYAILKTGLCPSVGLIKSKPTGDKPLHETQRIVKIAEDVMEEIDRLTPYEKPDLVVIEGLAFMARNTHSLVQLAGLNYLIRALLNQFEWPFIIVAPTTLKKFITGKGNSDKNIVMMNIYRDYSQEFIDDNVADAFALAAFGMALKGQPLRTLTVPQKEAIELIKKQL